MIRVDRMTADRVDGGFAEDDLPTARFTDPEVASVLASARRHSAPKDRACTPKFRAHGPVEFACDQEKDGVSTSVRIQATAFDKRLKKMCGLRLV